MDRLWNIAIPEIVSELVPLMRAAPVKASKPATAAPNPGKLAVLQIVGPMTRFGLSSPWRDTEGTATVPLADQVRRLTANSAVEGVAFWIDTPGGTFAGTPELSDAVAELSKSKPTVGFIDGLGASAGFFVASQLRKLYATKSSLTGSIGTLHVIPDFSAMMERSGIRVHVISTGELKGTGVFGAPLTPDQIDYLRDMVNEAQAMFDLAVQTGRRLNLAQMKAIRPGQVFHTATARKMGLVDGIASTLPEAVTLAGLGHLLN